MPKVKKIRVCTGAELKKMCPQAAPCKPPPPPDDSLALIARIIWFALKAGLAGGLLLLSYQAGLWGDNDDSQRLYEKLCKLMSGDEDEGEEADEEFKVVLGYCNQNKIFMDASLQEEPHKCPLPTDEQNLFYFQRKWNDMVIEIGNILISGPVALFHALEEYFKCNSELDVEECKKKAKEVEANEKAVSDYNNRLHEFEEKKVKEREERVKELQERYKRKLKVMEKQHEDGSVPANVEQQIQEEEEEEERKKNTCP